MKDLVEIKSNVNAAKITFAHIPGPKYEKHDYLQISLYSDAARATKPVWFASYFGSLPNFFAGLEKNWKGWRGERDYQSIESDFLLKATSDKLGHCTLKATLWAHHSFDLSIWLVINNSELHGIASQLREFMTQ